MKSHDVRHQPATEYGTSAAVFQLIIERGASRFPVRPITGDRYLIGAGSNCHLQLGGEIPLLHSIIIPEEEHLWIDAVSPAPALIVNGQQLREGSLTQGDVIVIGDFVFCVDQVASAVLPSSNASASPLPDPATMSATELVDILDQKMEDLEKFEQNQRQSASALKQAALQSEALPQIDWSHDPRASLLQLLSELHDRSRALDIREASLRDHASKLAHSQEELRRHLELLCPPRENSESQQDNGERRRSA